MHAVASKTANLVFCRKVLLATLSRPVILFCSQALVADREGRDEKKFFLFQPKRSHLGAVLVSCRDVQEKELAGAGAR